MSLVAYAKTIGCRIKKSNDAFDTKEFPFIPEESVKGLLYDIIDLR